MHSVSLTQEILKKIIHYNPDTGTVHWRERGREFFDDEWHWKSWNTNYSGKEAGSTPLCNGKEYTCIRIFYKAYRVHRLIWLYMEGYFPETIDHIDGCGTNNRFNNLRDVSRSDNQKNLRLCSNNTSGFTGVSWCKR